MKVKTKKDLESSASMMIDIGLELANSMRLDGYTKEACQILTRRYPRLIKELLEKIPEDIGEEAVDE